MAAARGPEPRRRPATARCGQLFPDALGFVSRDELERAASTRAAVVVVPVAQRGLRRRLRGGDGARQAGRRRAPPAASLDLVRRRRDRACSSSRGDPTALRAAIDRLLADPALRKRLGAAARAWIIELCSWDKVIAETIETYEHAVGAAKSRSK